jgi:hypothetical protein
MDPLGYSVVALHAADNETYDPPAPQVRVAPMRNSTVAGFRTSFRL